jgi:predicted dienelactone hydrolase
MLTRRIALYTILVQAWALPLPTGSHTRQVPSSSFKAGLAFRTFEPPEPYNWRGAKTHALLIAIWYPAATSALDRPLEIPGLSSIFVLGNVAQDADLDPLGPRFPLIVMSHGTGGSGLSMAWLGAELARHGYVVAAVNHPGNNGSEAYTAEGFSTWWERARDLSVVINFVLSDPKFGKRVDANRIGAVGFSLGGYTMIEIAGGITDPAAFKEFCASPKADGICKSPPEFPTLFEDFDRLSKTNPSFQKALLHASDSYRDPRVRAVFAMAPALGPAFRRASLEKVAIPVRIVAGQADANVPITSSAKYLAAHIPHAELTILPGSVGHYVFLDSCTDAGRESRAMLCRDAASVDRDEVHAKATALAIEFFNCTLK